MGHQINNNKIKYEATLEKAFRKEEGSFTGFFIKNFRFTYLIILAILFLGTFSLLTLPREANPEVKVPFAVVTTVLPGSTPTDVEDLITDKIENKIKNLDNLKRYSSTSGQGFSSVFVEFEAKADLKESFRKLQETVDGVKPELPPEAEDPMVTEVRFSDIPIVTYSLVGELSDVELKKYADVLKEELEKIKNVSKVVILGGLEREFQIIVNQTKLANFNVSLSQIVNAIARSNFNLPSGSIEVDGFKYNVRVGGKFKDVHPLGDVVVVTYNGTPIYIKDLGEIIDGHKERSTESRIGFKNQLPKNTISLQIFKRTGGNILDIIKESQAVIARLQKNNTLPPEITIQKTNDNSVFIREDLTRLGKSGIQTMILIVFILLIVLSFLGALITGLSVPIAFLLAFIVLKIQGMTLNSLVLFSLVLSLGLMVDNSIVIIEGINEYITKYKKSPYRAAVLSVWNFKWPITSGTLTTVSAFLPILLVSGILGEFLSVLPKTITATLLSSLFVAIVIIPTLVSRLLKINHKKIREVEKNPKRHQYVAAIRHKLQSFYIKLMRQVLPLRKKRRLFIIIAWALFAISIVIPISGLMKVQMFPKIDVDYFIVNVKLPVGSVLEKTRAVTGRVETMVSNIPEVDNYVTNIGTSISLGLTDDTGTNGSHLANITVNLIDKDERKRKSFEIAESFRPQFKSIQGAEVTVEELAAGPPAGSPIEVRILGDDLAKLATVAQDMVNYFKNVPGVINVKDSIAESTGDFTFTVDKEKANFYGLDVVTIASALRTAVFGTKASEVTLGGNDIDITVKYNKNKLTKVDDLENILLFTPGGANISLKQVATLKLEPSLLSIAHRNGERIVTVTADTEGGINLQKTLQGFNEFTSNLNLPEGISIDIGGEVEDIEKSFRETFLSMILAIILIAIILVLQFNSFRQPFIILFTLPLAIVGVMIGLNLLRIPFSFTAFIGLVALSGIVVNDAIVLIDRINKNLKSGMDFLEGIIEGGVTRMQPIFLTTLTTIAGIFPLIYADELWRGLAITVIFGLIFSTVLTLVMVPIVYFGLCYKKR